MEKVVRLCKRFILGFFILYGFNVIAENFNIIIPINIYTVSFTSILGLPALFSLVLLFVLIR